MWYQNAVLYQIYPLGLCGAPLQTTASRRTACAACSAGSTISKRSARPVCCSIRCFESDAHGYDTRDFNKVDCRLGDADDLKAVCEALHAAGLKVMLDGVFNHVGRGFWAFRDVQEKRWTAPIKTGST